MKKMFAILLCVILVMTCAYSAPAKASGRINEGFYIVSSDCPDEYIEYAENNVARFILGNDEYSITEFDSLYIGTPFTFSEANADIFYFPIYGDGNIIYFFRVFSNGQGGLSGVLSSVLVEELNEVAAGCSINSPIELTMQNTSIVATVGGVSEILMTYPDNFRTSDNVLDTRSSANQLDIISVKPEAEINFSNIPAPITDWNSKYLNLHGNIPSSSWPTQKGNNWCVAYAFSAILKYIGRADLTAEELMLACYGEGNYTEKTGMAEMMGIVYARTLGSNPIMVNVAADFGVLSGEIWGDRPVELGMGYYVNGRRESGHAIVLRGFNATTQTYSIWNPWYTQYETFEVGGAYVPYNDQGRIYYHDMTTYNWT